MSDDRAPPFFLPFSCSRARASSAMEHVSPSRILPDAEPSPEETRLTFLLLLLLLGRNQALTELLLAVGELGGAVWRDVGESGCAGWALCGCQGAEAA